jgi:2-polyprenyl-3-methyl-5-hydroxy-6-metoxy-1,4-benzoquinol methylase
VWESPIYKFKTQIGRKKEEILIDVTGSAPNFSEPGKQLEGTLEVLLKGLEKEREPSKIKILDFGAAKLRNTIHLLKKGYTVYSCEFDDLFKRSRQASSFLGKAKEFPNFKKLIFPDEFIDFNKKFDVVMLINVLNIMPVPIERMCVLALCREKMKENGRLLWYTQHGTYSHSVPVAQLYDGIVTGKGRKYNMFYRDFSREEICNMLRATGFSYNDNFKFPMSGSNQAYVFSADGDILVGSSLGLTELLKRKITRSLETIERATRWRIEGEEAISEKVVYDAKVPKRVTKPKTINILESYLEEAKKLKPGKRHAYRYHDLIFNILKIVFEYSLRKPIKEDPVAGGTQRVDITFQNYRDRGFFRQLDEGYHIVCPNIFIECKNYEDPGNPEFSQIQNRLNKKRGQFGIIVCRKIVNEAGVRERQRNLAAAENYVIAFTDLDIEKLVSKKLEGKEDEIDDFIEKKFKELI